MHKPWTDEQARSFCATPNNIRQRPLVPGFVGRRLLRPRLKWEIAGLSGYFFNAKPKSRCVSDPPSYTIRSQVFPVLFSFLATWKRIEQLCFGVRMKGPNYLRCGHASKNSGWKLKEKKSQTLRATFGVVLACVLTSTHAVSLPSKTGGRTRQLSQSQVLRKLRSQKPRYRWD